MAVKKTTKIESKEQTTDSGIIIPGHDDARKIMGNEGFIEMMDAQKKEAENCYAGVRKHDDETFIVYNKDTGAELRVYIKERGCEDPEKCAYSYAAQFKKV